VVAVIINFWDVTDTYQKNAAAMATMPNFETATFVWGLIFRENLNNTCTLFHDTLPRYGVHKFRIRN